MNFHYNIVQPTPLTVTKKKSSQSLLYEIPAPSPTLRSLDLAGVQVFPSPMRMISGHGEKSPGTTHPLNAPFKNSIFHLTAYTPPPTISQDLFNITIDPSIHY